MKRLQADLAKVQETLASLASCINTELLSVGCTKIKADPKEDMRPAIRALVARYRMLGVKGLLFRLRIIRDQAEDLLEAVDLG